MTREIEAWYSEYDLRQFIDLALRWQIDDVFESRSPHRPFSIFTEYVASARINFEKFKEQLNNKLTNNVNWKAIEIDLRNRFLGMLNGYINWYQENQGEFSKFLPSCPYTLMLSIIESTKAEILQYFGSPKARPKKLADLIIHKNPSKIVDAIKNKFKNIKGKRLKLLYLAMVDTNLLDGGRNASLFHSACESDFDWNIASYQAMNDYEFNDRVDKKDRDKMNSFLNEVANHTE